MLDNVTSNSTDRNLARSPKNFVVQSEVSNPVEISLDSGIALRILSGSNEEGWAAILLTSPPSASTLAAAEKHGKSQSKTPISVRKP